MTDEEMSRLWNGRHEPPVHVKDYAYDGWMVACFTECNGQWRCVVEDRDGRLSIHNASQLTAERKKTARPEGRADGTPDEK